MTHVVICGGGAIGLLTARLLARRELEVTIVERENRST
ncbi:FAD-dependent oxidoreductase [Microlunatus aurantiacus]